MKIRRATKDDLDQVAQVTSQAYGDSVDWRNTLYAAIDKRIGARHIMVVEVDGEIVSSLVYQPTEVWIGSDRVTLGTVGGVGTAPKHQRKGYAGALITETVRILREEGLCASALHPFSYAYYRKFGWELGGQRMSCTFEPKVLEFLGEPKDVRPYRDQDLTEVSEIYNRFAQTKCALTVRDEDWWREVIFREQRRKMVVYDHQGIEGYLVYGVGKSEEGRRSGGAELVAATARARQSLLAFLAHPGEKVDQVALELPVDDPLLAQFPNAREVSATIAPGFMFRVADPELAINSRTVDPSLEGQFRLSVEDPVFGQQTLTVIAEHGKLEVAGGKTRKRGASDLSCDIQAFAQIYVGYISAGQAAEIGKLRVRSRKALSLADAIWPRRVPYRSGLELG